MATSTLLAIALLAEGIIGFWLMDGYHSSKWRNRHPEAKKFLVQAKAVSAGSTAKSTSRKLLDFVEHSYFTLPVGIVAGIVGFFVYAPVFAVCGACVLLAFHRTGVVRGRSIWRIQLPVYALLCALIVGGLYELNNLLQNKLRETNTTLAQLVASTVIKLMFQATKPPHFDISLPNGMFMSTRTADDHSALTSIFLQVGITNAGAPSSASDWSLHYHSATLDIESASDKISSVPMVNRQGERVQFNAKDNIYEKTLRPIATGETVTGWAKFNIPGDHMAELHAAQVVLTVQTHDYTGHPWNAEFHIGELETVTPYYPGTTGPKISVPKQTVRHHSSLNANGSNGAQIVGNYIIGSISAENSSGFVFKNNYVDPTSKTDPIEQAEQERANREEMEKIIQVGHSKMETAYSGLPTAEREEKWSMFLKKEAEVRALENNPQNVLYFLQRVKEDSPKPKQP